MWPSLYNSVTQVRRKSSNFPSESQFGVENIPARVENLIDEDKEKLFDCDVYRNYWIDGLEWINYPETKKTINYFPAPEKKLEYNLKLPEKYIVLHPMSRPTSERGLEKWYIEKLCRELCKEIPVVILCEEKYLDFYKFCQNWENIMVIPADLYECYWLIENSAAFLGVDSSIYHMSKSCGVPYYCFSNFCTQPFQIPYFQQLRWHQRPQSIIPQNYDISFVKKLIIGAADRFEIFLYPEIYMRGENLENAIVKRNFV